MEEKKRGRPLQRDQWAGAMWDQLWLVRPDGLHPGDLRNLTGLSQRQVQSGARFLRDTFDDERDVPIVYVRSLDKWFIAPTWEEHAREAVRSDYLMQITERLRTAEKLLEKSERAFPGKARRIRRIKRTAAYLREETEDLVTELSAS